METSISVLLEGLQHTGARQGMTLNDIEDIQLCNFVTVTKMKVSVTEPL